MKKYILILILLFTAISLFAQTGRQIMEKKDAVNNSDTTRSLVIMELIDKNGGISSRQVEQISVDKDDTSYSLILFHSPSNVKNTRFLSIKYSDDRKDQWIYLPALKKVRRIASGEGNGSFMGTDFTYDDISGNDIDDNTYKIIADEKYNEYNCWKIEETPVNSSNSQYARTLSWIDKNSYLVIKQEFYDESENLMKTLEVEQIAEVQGIWTRLKIRMTNNQSGHATLLEIKKQLYNSEINMRVFSTTFLETGRL